jgi:outer membrane protein OmpA-like peptidoglycan-associated protein
MNARRGVGSLFAVLALAGSAVAQEPAVPKTQVEKPELRAIDVYSGVGDQLKQVTDSQIKVLQRLTDITQEDDPEKPDLLFRMAELYAEQTRYYNFKARDLQDRILLANKAGDQEKAAKVLELQKEFEKQEKQWLLQAVKKYIEVANGPKYQSYQRMDQVLFSLAYLLTQANKEDQARVFFKRLIKDYPQSPFLPHAYLSFGEYYFHQKDMENALKFFEKTLETPDSPVAGYALYMKGWAKYTLEDFAGAIESFIAVIRTVAAREKKGPADHQLLKESRKDLVRVFARIGKPEDAWPFFQKHGGDYAPTMMQRLADLYKEQGKTDLAAAVLRTLGEAVPAAAQAKTFQLENGALKLPGPVVFEAGNDKIKPESEAALNHVKDYLEAKTYISLLRIECHTDGDGEELINQALSERRAMAVARWLVDKGIDGKRLIPVGFGGTKPIAANDTPEGKAQNRRTAFVNAALRGRPLGGLPVDGGGKVAGDPSKK